MDISYVGKDKFKIRAKTGAIVADSVALTISHKTGGEDFVISNPGEFEVEGISVFGFRSDDANIYVIQFEDLRVVYLGALTKAMSEKMITDLENIDVVIFSTDSIPLKDSVEMISKLEPYYVLPFGEMTEKFVASYEHGNRVVKSLNLSKVSLPEDLTEVITFE